MQIELRMANLTSNFMRMTSTGLLVSAGLLASACVVDAEPVPEMVELTGAQPLNASPDQAGASILAHPGYSLLSQKGTAFIAAVSHRVGTMPSSQVPALIQTLESCDPTTNCEAILQQEFGLAPADIQAAAAAAEQISLDLGLSGMDPTSRMASFQHAQVAADGEGFDNDVIAAVLPNPSFYCNTYQGCTGELEITLGVAKADFMTSLSLATDPAPVGPSPQAEGGDGGGDAAVIVAAIKVAVEVVKWLEDIIWDRDEEDKECHTDDHCPAEEYCHKLGSNDCRPRRNQGALCSRHTQCSTGCCRFNWGWRVCRPSDKCN